MRSTLVNLGLKPPRLEIEGVTFLVEATRWHVEREESARWQKGIPKRRGWKRAESTRAQECSIENQGGYVIEF
jgi:hypothetical protein